MSGLDQLSDKQIENFVRNYENMGAERGGKFTLAELKLERQRRIPSPFPAAEVARAIVTLAKESSDGLVSYKQIWEIFRPGKVWIGNAPRSEMAKALGRVIAFCIDSGLPILTTLVVRGDSRTHSDDAIQNICNEAKSMGVDVGLDPRAFVKSQQEAALHLSEDWMVSSQQE